MADNDTTLPHSSHQESLTTPQGRCCCLHALPAVYGAAESALSKIHWITVETCVCQYNISCDSPWTTEVDVSRKETVRVWGVHVFMADLSAAF